MDSYQGRNVGVHFALVEHDKFFVTDQRPVTRDLKIPMRGWQVGRSYLLDRACAIPPGTLVVVMIVLFCTQDVLIITFASSNINRSFGWLRAVWVDTKKGRRNTLTAAKRLIRASWLFFGFFAFFLFFLFFLFFRFFMSKDRCFARSEYA